MAISSSDLSVTADKPDNSAGPIQNVGSVSTPLQQTVSAPDPQKDQVPTPFGFVTTYRKRGMSPPGSYYVPAAEDVLQLNDPWKSNSPSTAIA